MSNPNNYPWIGNSSDISGSGIPPARLAIKSTNGLYFSTATNSSILGFNNADLSIASDGTGDILLKTNGSTRVTVDDSGNMTAAKNITITDGVLTINNTTGGGTSDPLFVLNQNITNASLYQEINNSRTASNSTLYQISYKGKNSTNTSTIEYANMSVIPVSIGTTVASSKIDFKVSNAASYVLELESNNSVFTSNLSMSNKSVNGIDALNYNSGNIVAPDYVINLDGSSSSPYPLAFGSNNSTRILCKNIGLASPITKLPGSQQPPNGGSVYCSETFNSSLWIGTNNYIYWSQDNGSTWNTLNDSNGNAYYFNGAITCMKAYNVSSTFLIIGGLFTEASASGVSIPLNYIGIIDTSGYLSSMSWAQYSTSIGYNGYVMAIEYYNGYLYVGGNFTADNSSGNVVNCYYFSIIEYNGSGTFGPGFYLYSINNSSGAGTNGYVNSIIYDTTTSNGYLIVGGSFSNISDNISINITCNGAFFIGMNGPNVTTQPLAIDFMTGDVKSMIIIGSSIYVVGSFTNLNSYNYFATLTWNGSSGNYDVGPNPYSSSYTPTGDINFIGANYTNSTVYWGENFSPYKLYSNGNFIADSPSGFQWLSVIYLTGTAANGICFCPSGASYTFYYQQSGVLTLDSQGYIIVNNGQEYGPNAIITFPTKGTSILLEYNINNNKLSVISNNGCTGIGLSSGSGGISTISAGSGISVSSPTGPTSTIYNTGVTSINAGTGISINQSTGAVTITNTVSPAGTTQFITTIDTTTLPLIPADQTLNLVNAGVPASGKFSGAWTGQTLPTGEIVNASAIKVLFQLPTYTTPNGVFVIIGCESGRVYYTNGSINWQLAFTANGRIRTMWADNRTDGNGRFVFFGGDMTSVSGGIFGPTTTVNYMFAWDLNFTSFPAVPGAGIIPAWANRSGQTGFNGPVYSIVQMRGSVGFEYTPNNLLVGGAFTGTNTGGYSCLRIATIVMTYPGSATTTYNLFAPDNNSDGNTGFPALVRDISSWNGANVIVGDFLNMVYNSGAGLTTFISNYAVNWTTSSTGYNTLSAPKLIGATGTSLNAPMYSVDFTQDVSFGGSNAGAFILGGDATGVTSSINPSIPTIDRVFGYLSILLPGALISYDSTGTFFTAPVRLVEQSPDNLTAPAKSSYVSDTTGRLFKLSGGYSASPATDPELVTTLTGGNYITSASVMPSGFTFSGGTATTLYGFGTTRSDTIFSQSQTATTTPLLLNTSGNFVFVSVPASTTLELPTASGTEIIIGGASSSRIELKQRGSVIQVIYNSATSRFYVSNWISANVAVLDANIYAP